ncbi:MAG: prepilin-type N-terminal cleavage/methylation domain-containing protein [Acidobacteriota bacterium]|nr:prepilin-type N-terminal cleavage/methylation domain-containing protein [Acidobacteriota bacterium]
MQTPKETKNQSGFSLLELIVTMGVMLVIMAAVFSLMGSSLKTSNVAYELTNAQQSVRTAHEFFNRDLTVAGDGLLGISDNGIQVRLPFAQRLMQNPYQPTTLAGGFDSTGFAVLSIVNSDNEVAAGVVEPANIGATVPTRTVRSVPNATDRMTMVTVDPDSTFTPISPVLPAIVSADGTTVTVTIAQSGQCTAGDILFISNGDLATFGTVTGGCGATGTIVFADDAYYLNTLSTGTTPTRALAYLAALGSPLIISRMLIHHYFVDTDGLLRRRTYGVGGGVGFTDSVIAERVTRFQVRYRLFGFDANFDLLYTGLQNDLSYVAVAPAIPMLPSAVREVETAVTVETVHPVINDQRSSVNATATTSVRNLEFRNNAQ